MQNKILSVLVAATLVTGAARAQDAGVASPSTPAPAVQQPAMPATNPQPAPAPNQIIYAPRLPAAAELTSAAAAQGLAVEQISQTASQVIVTYRQNSGQTNTVAYQLLPTPGSTATTTTVIAPNPAPTVIYQTSPSVIYYDSYDTYRPYYRPYYYPPVSLSLGFGYYHGGGWGGHGWGHHHWR